MQNNTFSFLQAALLKSEYLNVHLAIQLVTVILIATLEQGSAWGAGLIIFFLLSFHKYLAHSSFLTSAAVTYCSISEQSSFLDHKLHLLTFAYFLQSLSRLLRWEGRQAMPIAKNTAIKQCDRTCCSCFLDLRSLLLSDALSWQSHWALIIVTSKVCCRVHQCSV